MNKVILYGVRSVTEFKEKVEMYELVKSNKVR